eukprot:5465875-Prymnesium_polylepis.1
MGGTGRLPISLLNIIYLVPEAPRSRVALGIALWNEAAPGPVNQRWQGPCDHVGKFKFEARNNEKERADRVTVGSRDS